MNALYAELAPAGTWFLAEIQRQPAGWEGFLVGRKERCQMRPDGGWWPAELEGGSLEVGILCDQWGERV